MWIEAHRLLPALPRAARIPFANGLGLSFMMAAHVGTFVGYYLATSLPALLSAGLLFLTPMSFLISTARNCRLLADWLALAFGIVVGAAAGLVAGRARSALDRHHRGLGGLLHSSHARRREVVAMTEVQSYLLLVLVGFPAQ